MNKEDYIFIKLKGGILRKIFHNDISHVKADGDYCKIFSSEKMHYIHSTLKAITENFPKNKFHQCNRGSIINVDKIKTIDSANVYLEETIMQVQKNYIEIEKNVIPLSKMYKNGLLKKINILPTTRQLSKKYEKNL